MISLTDEEIVLLCNPLAGKRAAINLQREAIAKAQLKKVINELPVIDCYGGNKLILAKDWQDMAEETK